MPDRPFLSLLDIEPAPMRHYIGHDHALLVGDTQPHVPGCLACARTAMLADGLDGHPCPYAYMSEHDGWLECSQPVGHAGDCTPV